MLEYLNLVVSLFKLILDGLSKTTDSFKASQKKELHRKVIAIQLYLEGIIERAEEILSLIDEYSKESRQLTQSDIERLQRLFYRQNNKIFRLIEMLSDEAANEIMKLFTPAVRRNIWALINLKGGFIGEMVSRFHNFEKMTVKNSQLIVKTKLFHWNHETFIKEGNAYLNHIERGLKDASISAYERHKEQKHIVNSLIDCSKELSDFIKSQIKIEEVVIRNRVNRTR